MRKTCYKLSIQRYTKKFLEDFWVYRAYVILFYSVFLLVETETLIFFEDTETQTKVKPKALLNYLKYCKLSCLFVCFQFVLSGLSGFLATES